MQIKNNNHTAETEEMWQDFIGTGSVYSYLRYKGIALCDTDPHTSDASAPHSAKIRDGEPIGYC